MPIISNKKFKIILANFSKILTNSFNIILRTLRETCFLVYFDNLLILLTLFFYWFMLLSLTYIFFSSRFLLYIIAILFLLLLTLTYLNLILLILLLTLANLSLIFLLNTLYLFYLYIINGILNTHNFCFIKKRSDNPAFFLGMYGRGEAVNFTLPGLLCSSTRTSTRLVSSTNIYIPRRSYPGKLPSGILGGIGKELKLPGLNSSGHHLTPSPALLNKNTPCNITTVNSSNTGATSPFLKAIKPYSASNVFKDTMFDQQKKQAEQMAKKKVEQANHENSTESLLLAPPVDYSHKNTISGFMSLSAQEKDNLQKLEFKMIILCKFLHLKYCFKAFNKGNHDFTNLYEKIYDSCKSFKFPSFFNKSKVIYNFHNEKMITLTQHLLNIIVPNKIPVHVLYQIAKSCGIKIDSYVKEETTRIGPYIELTVVNELVVLLKTYTSKEIEVHLVNSDNINGVKENFSPVISEIHTSQKHADGLIKVLLDAFKLYIDVKTFSAVGISHRRLSLFHPSKKKLQQFINDVKCSLNSYIIKNNIPDDHAFRELYKQLNGIIKNNDTEEVTYDNIIRLLCQTAVDPTYEDLPISLALPIGEDEAFTQILANIPQNVLEEVANRTNNEIRVIMDQTSSLEDKEAAYCILEKVLKESLPSYLTHEFFEKAITL